MRIVIESFYISVRPIQVRGLHYKGGWFKRLKGERLFCLVPGPEKAFRILGLGFRVWLEWPEDLVPLKPKS